LADNTQTKIWDTFATTTLDSWLSKDLIDELVLAHPFLAWLWGLDEGEKTILPSDIPPELIEEKTSIKYDTGNQIVVPLRNSRIGNIKWITRTERMSTAVPNPASVAIFDWSLLGAPLTVSLVDVARNEGAQRMNYVQNLAEILKTDMLEVLANSVFSDGTGDGGLEMLGLQAIAENTPTSTLGGIDRSAAGNDYWKNQTKDNGGGAMTLANVKSIFQLCRLGKAAPTFIVGDNAAWLKYSDLVEAALTKQIQHNEKFAKYGFQHFLYNQAVVVDDPACPVGQTYFLTKKAVTLYIDPRFNFTALPWVQAEAGTTKSRLLLLACQLVPTEPRRIGVLYNQSN
jgi:hypothetical protein